MMDLIISTVWAFCEVNLFCTQILRERIYYWMITIINKMISFISLLNDKLSR